MMGMAASRARSRIWYWRVRSRVRSVSTACRRRSGRSAKPITRSSKPRRKAIGHYALARMVPRLPRPRLRAGGNHPGDRAQQGALLGTFREGGIEQAAAAYHQRVAQWLRRQTYLVQMGEARQMLARYGTSRHRRPDPEEDIGKGCSRRSKYIVFTDTAEMRGLRA